MNYNKYMLEIQKPELRLRTITTNLIIFSNNLQCVRMFLLTFL